MTEMVEVKEDNKVQSGALLATLPPWSKDFTQYSHYFMWRAGYHLQNLPPHWSRQFEYPWIVKNGLFSPNHDVLDVAGGDSPLSGVLAEAGCSVTNIDISHEKADWVRNPKVKEVLGDAQNMPFPDESFDRVVCISSLEHMEDPFTVLKEMQRVLRTGGRMVVTMDVSSQRCEDHDIDQPKAEALLKTLGISLPLVPENVMQSLIQKPTPSGKIPLWIVVVCFWWDKTNG
jgi:2-polyprenyl-3-methyl-5-hydroxy-6-metoxy-1,4-benzoquinol methylase